MPYGTLNADKMTTSDGVSSSGLYGFKNRLINSAMVIDQRNAGASVTPSTTADAFPVDRWIGQVSQNSKLTMQQNAGAVTPPAGFTNYVGVTSSSAYSVLAGDYFLISQFIEGFNFADLGWGSVGASPVTLSFWVRSSLTGTFGGALLNSAQTRSYPFTYTISSANTWTQISITIAGDTTGTWVGATNGIGLRVRFGLGVGTTSSGTAGAWASAGYFSATGATSIVGTNGATFYITGVQLEKGSTATSFDYRPYGTELQLCQRYYEKSYAQGTTPGTSTNVGMTSSYVPVTGLTQLGFYIKFAVVKRTTASMTFYSGAGGAGNFSNDFAGTTNIASVLSSATGDCGTLVYNNAGISNFVGVHWIATSEL